MGWVSFLTSFQYHFLGLQQIHACYVIFHLALLWQYVDNLKTIAETSSNTNMFKAL